MMMMMHKALHPIDNTDCKSQEKKGGGVASIEDCADTSIQGLEDNIKKSKDWLITSASYNIGNIRTNRKTRKTRE